MILPPKGAPEGLSADGQRRRMVGCGALRRNVSRLSPSILLIFPVKRQRRYGSSSPPSFSLFLLCKPSLACMSQTYTVGGINSFHCESETLALPGIIDWYQKLAYYNWPGWLCWLQPKDGKPLLYTIPLCSSSHHFPNTFLFFAAPFIPSTAPVLFLVQVVSSEFCSVPD